MISNFFLVSMMIWSFVLITFPYKWLAALLRKKFLVWRQQRRDKAAAVLNAGAGSVLERTMLAKGRDGKFVPLEDILDPPCEKPLEHINLRTLSDGEKQNATQIGELRRTMNAREIAKANKQPLPELPPLDRDLLKAVQRSEVKGVCKHGTYLSDLCVQCRREVAGF